MPQSDRGMFAAAFLFWLTSMLLLAWYRENRVALYPKLSLIIEILAELWQCGFCVLLGIYVERNRSGRTKS